MSTGGYGAAAAIVGTELQGWAALLDKWAMKDAYNKEARQQAQYTQEAGQLFDSGLSRVGSTSAGQELAAGQAGREATYRDVNATPLSVQQTPLSSAVNARNNAYAQLLGGQRAKLGSYGDWLQSQWMQRQQTQRSLDQVSNFAQGQSAIFPLQMYAAQHSMDDLAAIGQAISSIGGGASNYGALFNSTPGQQNRSNPALDPGGELNAGGNANDPAGETYI